MTTHASRTRRLSALDTGQVHVAQDRFATLTTPLGDALWLSHMTGVEALGKPFSYELEVISEDPDLDENELIGQSATVHLSLPDGQTRHFNGLIASFGFGGTKGRYITYHATLKPWLFILAHASDCRIFQNMTVPEVLRQVFRDHGFSDFDFTLTGDYEARDYLVQYRETTLSFVSRLLEQEGIYYYFKHEADKHTLQLVDDMQAHETQPGYEEVPFFAPGRFHEQDHIDQWSARRHVRTGAYSVTDYDFEKPKADLSATRSMPGKYTFADKEHYDYPGEYTENTVGERYARTRMEELQATELGFSGHGNVRGLGPGMLFSLTRFPREKLNCRYLVVSATYTLDGGDFESQGGTASSFSCGLRAVDSTIAFVPRRSTPRPVIAGPQTATVVGADGHELWTDEYGRVKVQFHWDRVGQRNEDSSCWVRVAQLWAGAGWGGLHIPRIGHEVIVEFLEGDPDRPIITGRVYNRDNMPPYKLPDNQTQSGIKSHSTPGGSEQNFNELRFEDKKGKEQLFMQAERNMDTTVKKDQSLSVGGSRSKTVTGKETNTIHGGRKTTVDKYDELIVQDANRTTTVHGQYDNIVDKHFKVQQNTATQLLMDDKVLIESNGNIELKNGGVRYNAESGGTLTVSAIQELKLTCGPASITLSKDGTIVISGVSVQVGTQTNNTKYEPPGITTSAVKISQTAVGIHELAGALIKVG